jgi:hypothetical protein
MDYEIAEPKPAVLIESLRSVGYTLATAVADIIDNSIAAKGKNIAIDFLWAGKDSRIGIVDDGAGMSESQLLEAMRPGSKHPLEQRSPEDLGRFGLGLKTASFSQCRCLTVISKVKGGVPHSRCWNLDYVTETKQWRLIKEPPAVAQIWLERLSAAKSGTAVVWSDLDRITGGENTGDAAAHTRFNDAINQVSRHLSMVFHRFMEAGDLRITVNDRSKKLTPWNPFLEQHPATDKTPVERILHGETHVEFRGFVLPHKDKLTDPEFAEAAGPLGWNAQQGFYVYRNRRLLVSGDWLRLGRPNPWTKEEQFKLARIRLDITNQRDGDWQLDVKKSTATPPAQVRARLTDLAGSLRSRARGVFVHRGLYGPRSGAPKEIERPWISAIRGKRRVYSINRKHPLVAAVLESAGSGLKEIESMLRVLEETVPVQQIWLDTAEDRADQALPYEDVGFDVLRGDLRVLFGLLRKSGINAATAKERLRVMEPFNRYPKLVAEL